MKQLKHLKHLARADSSELTPFPCIRARAILITPRMRIFRATIAALVGAILAFSLYLAWFFKFTGQTSPWDGATLAFIVLTGVIAAVCGLLGGFVGALIAPETPRGAADAIAALIALGAAFAETHTPGQHHYPQALALLVAAPAAYIAGRFRQPVAATR